MLCRDENVISLFFFKKRQLFLFIIKQKTTKIEGDEMFAVMDYLSVVSFKSLWADFFYSIVKWTESNGSLESQKSI